MIGFADLETLDEDQRRPIEALLERSSTIWDLPEDLAKIRVWDELIADCERAGFPHLVASSRLGQYSTFAAAGLAAEALEAYVKLMQVIRRHGDLIAPDNVVVMLNSVATAAMTLTDDPTVPLERITRAIDLVEGEMRLRGVDVVGSYVARAAVAAAAGDGPATAGWIERWRSGNSQEWRADSPGVVQMEVPLIATFDPVRARDTLEQRLRVLDVDVHHVDVTQLEGTGAGRLLTMLAFLLLRTGRRDEAHAIADRLVDGLGIAELARESVPDYLVPLLEHRPDQALVVVDWALANHELDASGWELTAAVARSRTLADPEGEEGRLLRALAEQAAAAHDRRGGTDVHTRELQAFWWAGLPQGVRPALADDPEVWDDREERAERILAAGWLPRTGAVSVDDPPIAIKHRYVALMDETMTLLSAGSSEEADALADRLSARAEQLRCATSGYCVPLLHGLRAGQHGDAVTLVRGFRRAQRELVEHAATITEPIQAIGEKVFSVTVEQAVLAPGVSWAQIEELVNTEARIRRATGGPESRVDLARAEIAAHLDDAVALRTAVLDLEGRLREEEDRLDRIDIDLEIVRLTAFHAPELAAARARWIADVGDAEQARAATAWSCWFRVGAGDRVASAELAELLASVDGDVEAFGALPGWVLLEGLAGSGTDLQPVVDGLLEDVGGDSGSDLYLVAAAGSVLLARSPDDPRGPELHARAVRIAGALDARNGSTQIGAWVGRRWYPGDSASGALA